MAMNRAQFAKLLQDGLNTVWGMEYDSYPEEFRQIFKMDSSSKAYEEDQLVTGFDVAVVKPEGSAVTFAEAIQAWTSRYTHITVALAFQITEEAIEDNLYMAMGSKYTRALAESMQHAKEVNAISVLNNGYSASFLGGDGVALASASHPLAGGGTASNILATPADLSEAALEDILIQIRRAKNDRGLPIALKAQSVVIPPDLMFVANRILRSQGRVGTADNDINAIKSMGIFGAEPIVMTRLTDTNGWWIKTNAQNGLRFFTRKPIATKMDTEFGSGNYRYKARERYSAGFSDWRGMFGSQGI